MIIFGFRTTVALLATLLVQCARCHTPAAHHVRRLRRWFTLFFIPLIPYRTQYVTTCTYCGAELVIPEHEALRLAATGQSASAQPNGPEGRAAAGSSHSPFDPSPPPPQSPGGHPHGRR